MRSIVILSLFAATMFAMGTVAKAGGHDVGNSFPKIEKTYNHVVSQVVSVNINDVSAIQVDVGIPVQTKYNLSEIEKIKSNQETPECRVLTKPRNMVRWKDFHMRK